MKERILTGWNWVRMIYLLTGLTIIIQAIVTAQWIGIALGGYFAAMAIFRFGCAAGSCFGGSCSVEPRKKEETSPAEIN